MCSKLHSRRHFLRLVEKLCPNTEGKSKFTACNYITESRGEVNLDMNMMRAGVKGEENRRKWMTEEVDTGWMQIGGEVKYYL